MDFLRRMRNGKPTQVTLLKNKLFTFHFLCGITMRVVFITLTKSVLWYKTLNLFGYRLVPYGGTSSEEHLYTSPHTHTSWQPPEDFNFSPPPYQINSTYCIVVNGQPIPGLIGCLSDFVFVLLCPCLSISLCWLQSSQPGGWIRQERDNWLPRWARSFISVGLPGLIETG